MTILHISITAADAATDIVDADEQEDAQDKHKQTDNKFNVHQRYDAWKTTHIDINSTVSFISITHHYLQGGVIKKTAPMLYFAYSTNIHTPTVQTSWMCLPHINHRNKQHFSKV